MNQPLQGPGLGVVFRGLSDRSLGFVFVPMLLRLCLGEIDPETRGWEKKSCQQCNPAINRSADSFLSFQPRSFYGVEKG